MPFVLENGTKKRADSESTTDNDDEPQYEPVVTLPEVEISTNEENETELLKVRAKLYRFDTSDPKSPEWKERGTGEAKILVHKENFAARVVMRRDKTLKLCANHFITPWMELKPNTGSNKAFVWTVLADFADAVPKSDCLAIRFATPEIADQWKNKFDEAQKIVKEKCALYKDDKENSTAVKLEEESHSEDEAESNHSTSEEEKVIEQIAELKIEK